jgi:ferrous iron transport protein B
MSVTTEKHTRTIALIGNPNTGKSTLFNALAGVRQRTGNYPGVTVEKKLGRFQIDGVPHTLIDLPGTYSLAPRSPDEMVAVDVLLGRASGTETPDLVLCIVDASNLERNLYLVSQVLELVRPTVLALNMIDSAADKGVAIDVERLEARLGLPVVATRANRKIGISELKAALARAAENPNSPPDSPFPEAFRREVADLQQQLPDMPRYLVERLLLDTSGYLERAALPGVDKAVRGQIRAARERLAAAGAPVPGVEAMARYGWVGQVLEGVIERGAERRLTASDRADKILTHKLWGTLVFVALMLLVFQAIFTWASAPMDAIEAGVGAVGGWVASLVPPGALQSLLVDGVVGGVGSVLVFLPQILILFVFIAVLEDCGYMARAAYLMDKLMARVGLSGKSFIPLLSSFACAIPGIMAARVIENRRDRLTTMLVAPLMSCSARLPVYVLLISAFVPDKKWLGPIGLQTATMFAMYSVGAVAAVFVAWALNKTLLRGNPPPFVMELPSYKLPSPRLVARRAVESGWAFLLQAGTLIFAVSILIWAAAYYPRADERVEAQFGPQLRAVEAQMAELQTEAENSPAAAKRLAALAVEKEELDHRVASAYLRHSLLGQAGHWIEPVVRPLGWDWRIGCAVIASFPAREVVIGTLGVIYNLGGETDEQSQPLRQKLRDATWDGTNERVFNVPVALSIMVFFALCAQCVSTLAVMKRETGTWRWPAFTFVYMTTLAYFAALATYQIGAWLA